MAFALQQPSRHDVYDFISPTKNLQNAAAGKSILVTGAGTGIGKTIAHTFALAGAQSITIVARRRERLEECKSDIEKAAPECKVTIVADTDVADEAAVAKLFESLENAPDVLINNAAKSGTIAPLVESAIEDWWNVQEVNVKGVYLTSRAYLRKLAGRKGRIINISSTSSWRTSPGFSAYSVSKTALNRFTEFVDQECKDASGTRCFAVHPGGVKGTDMSSPMPPAVQTLLIDARESLTSLGVHEVMSTTESKRASTVVVIDANRFFCEAELPAGTCLYLSCDRADFLGGRFIPATWDMEELEQHKERIEKEELLKTKIVGIA